MKYKKLLPLFSAVVFCGAAYLVYRALRRYQLQEIVESVLAISPRRLALGGLFAAGSYVSLTLFDVLAIRYVDASLPYRRIALASFSALSIGHTIGIAALSSGAIRYRFYSRWGIGAADVARIILFCGATVGLGLNTLGGITLLLQPEKAVRLLGLSPALSLAFGIACLALTVLYVALAALLHRPLTIRRWKIPMPPPKLALAQVVIGVINYAFVAATLHALLPPGLNVRYLTVVAVYVLGNLASIVSHVPGGIGVVEALVLYLLPHPAVVAALVAFRVVYFLVPFVFGILLLAAYELILRRRAASPRMGVVG